MQTGVPHRSLARDVLASAFAGCETWESAAAVSQAATIEFFSENDAETSLWDDGPVKENRTEILRSLLFSRRSIGKISVALLWQDALPEEVGVRITQSDADGPYTPARHLHYHLANPKAADYTELALAVGRRHDITTYTRSDLLDFLEEAQVLGIIPSDIDPRLRNEIDKVIRARLVTPHDLQAAGARHILDIRTIANRVSIHGSRSVQGSVDHIRRDLIKNTASTRDTIVIYCEDGTTSRDVARALRAETNYGPKVLIGGIAAWITAGLPTTAA